MKKYEIINALILRYNYKSYLEVGVADPRNNYFLINCENKECGDPYFDNDGLYHDYNKSILTDFINNELTYHMTSDEMFSMLPADKCYDIIFLDGLHTKEQIKTDIYNALSHLTPYGIIIIHDCLPTSEISQRPERDSVEWFGDVWKALYSLIHQNRQLYINVVNTDCGCGLLSFYNKDAINWDLMDINYDDVFKPEETPDMNVISPDEFMSIYINNSYKRPSYTYCVVIPVYKSEMEDDEILSFNSAYMNYSPSDIYIITYPELNLPEMFTNCNKVYFDKSYFESVYGYNRLCMSVCFYEAFKQYDYMLIHQLDAYTIYNNINYFINMEYDYYGAEWTEASILELLNKNKHMPMLKKQTVGNGGFSLRKIEPFLNILKTADIDITFASNNAFEDLMFCLGYNNILNICPPAVAHQFSWEAYTGYDITYFPMGMHNIKTHQEKFWNEIIRPELVKRYGNIGISQ